MALSILFCRPVLYNGLLQFGSLVDGCSMDFGISWVDDDECVDFASLPLSFPPAYST